MISLYKFIKKYNLCLVAFLLGCISIISIYIIENISPFGKNSMLTIDFYHQYAPLLAEFYDRVVSFENLIYSFNTGFGIPFFRNFANYLASPLNILIFLFQRSNLITSYSIIIGIRTIFTLISITYYFKKKFNKIDLSFVGLGLLYSFSAYFIAYHWNIMWLDGMIFLPLISLGIERIVDKNNGILYLISLTLMIYSNYFIGYMLCLFSCIYFVAYLILQNNEFCLKYLIKKILLFLICSLAAGALNAWILLPMYDALSSTDAVSGSMPLGQYYAFGILDFFKNHLTGVKTTVLASDSLNIPNVSVGILSFALLIVFIFSKNIPFKTKTVYLCILLLLCLSFYFGPIDYIWHAFHVPNDLPFRYSFIYSFILILISAYAIKNLKYEKYFKIFIIYIFCILFITFVYISNFQNITKDIINLNYICITIYFVLYSLSFFFKKYKKIFTCIFLFVICIECIISTTNNWNMDVSIIDYYSNYSSIRNSIEMIKEDDNELFYRIERNQNETLNDPAWYDYYGQSIFSSLAYSSLSKFNNNLGMPGNYINSYYYKQNTPIYDLMFDIKYQIGHNIDENRYDVFLNRNNREIHKSKYTVGLMFGVNNKIKGMSNEGENPFELQNSFIKLSTNVDNVLYKILPIEEELIFSNDSETIVKTTYENTVENIYLYPSYSDINYIIINDNVYYKGDSNLKYAYDNGIMPLGNHYCYDEKYVINEKFDRETFDIYVSYSNYHKDIDVYTINNERFINSYEILVKNKVNITRFDEHIIEGNINLTENKTIYTSIPYDKGWKVYSNGNKVETFMIADCLLGFDLEIGENNIVLKYIPPYFYLGIFISIFTLIFIITYFYIKDNKYIYYQIKKLKKNKF